MALVNKTPSTCPLPYLNQGHFFLCSIMQNSEVSMRRWLNPGASFKLLPKKNVAFLIVFWGPSGHQKSLPWTKHPTWIRALLRLCAATIVCFVLNRKESLLLDPSPLRKPRRRTLHSGVCSKAHPIHCDSANPLPVTDPGERRWAGLLDWWELRNAPHYPLLLPPGVNSQVSGPVITDHFWARMASTCQRWLPIWHVPCSHQKPMKVVVPPP